VAMCLLEREKSGACVTYATFYTIKRGIAAVMREGGRPSTAQGEPPCKERCRTGGRLNSSVTYPLRFLQRVGHSSLCLRPNQHDQPRSAPAHRSHNATNCSTAILSDASTFKKHSVPIEAAIPDFCKHY
jgi:hypothetical protein